ncbi:MAG TPA: glycosyltransferase family 1 protein, partial [Candidatus Limnocylindrales bacterium]|nr:glycosyltransferase family 1 protein [Candidatus Limnocylindrales bacterium]
IKKYYSVPEEKFVMTPIPPIPKGSGRGFNLADIGVKGKYILFVGTLEPRKNVLNLVKAYEQLPSVQRDNYQLVLVGGTGWYMEETMEYISRLQDKGIAIITPGYISNEAKAALYEHASLFVLPSHYEGFGMPILEAMDYGIPTAVSDIEVFHEVAGNASLYFDKDSPASIAGAMARVLTNPALQKELVAKGRERLQAYSWQKVAQSVYESIRQICDRV